MSLGQCLQPPVEVAAAELVQVADYGQRWRRGRRVTVAALAFNDDEDEEAGNHE
jgi:hypothetical protein